MSVAFTAGRAELGSSGADTGWIDLRHYVAPVSWMIAGTFVGTVSIDYSNAEAISKGSEYVTDGEAFTTTVAPRPIAPGTAKFVRFRMSAYTSGTAIVSFGRGLTSGDHLEDVSVQSAATT